MKRSPLRKQGKSETADLKRAIQATVREIVMIRDGGCILRNKRHCGAALGEKGYVFQADHLISRAHSATFADPRLIVCVCRNCHFWKSVGSNLRKGEYDALVRTILSRDRVALWDRAEQQSWKPAKMDWKLELAVLRQELERMRNAQDIL
jgi:hypothetical protein